MRKRNLFERIFLAVGSLIIFSIFPITFLAQTPKDVGKEPLVVEVVEQTDSPILITTVSVDNSAESHQTINFVIQNVSDKNIKASVLLHGRQPGVNGSTTSFFQSFATRQMIQEAIYEERVNIREGGKMFLSVDYVEFEDGGSWGGDSQKMSEHIAGMKAGQENAVAEIKKLSGNQKTLSDFLRQDLAQIKPLDVGTAESEKWRRGFLSGHKSTLRTLQSAYEKQGSEAVAAKLKDLEKSIELRKTR